MCMQVSSKKKIWKKNIFFFILKVTEETRKESDPDPLVIGLTMDPRIRIPQIPNTDNE